MLYTRQYTTLSQWIESIKPINNYANDAFTTIIIGRGTVIKLNKFAARMKYFSEKKYAH